MNAKKAWVVLIAVSCMVVFCEANGDDGMNNETIYDTSMEEKTKTVDDYLNVCLDGKNHKSKPGPEATLFEQCEPWQNRSCCTEQVTKDFHLADKWYNMDWNHCEGKVMSTKCRGHFLQDLCFYECSPNVGPWLQKVNMKIRNEKAFNVPLCQSECTLWWEDCKEEYTCIDNWGKDFNFSTGENKCPTDTTCRPFTEVFKNANNFCEKVWNYSWKVVPDTEDCMKLWFNGTGYNPNDAIAERKARQLVAHSTMLNGNVCTVFVLSVLSILYKFM